MDHRTKKVVVTKKVEEDMVHIIKRAKKKKEKSLKSYCWKS